MNLLKSVLGGFPPNDPSTNTSKARGNVVDLQQMFQDITTLKHSVEGLRFSKRNLAHELVLVVRENSRLEEQVHSLKDRITALEKIIKS